MALFSQSLFLQALGWATLNSLWQVALLWMVYVAAQHFTSFSSAKKYALAVGSLGISLVWFLFTLISYYSKGTHGALTATAHELAPSSTTWNIVLSSASVTYLLLLAFPAYRLAKNWQYIIRLKKKGLQKAGLNYRLFVKKVALQLGIQKPVHVFISSLIASPVTIGYLKPIILLPVAALNSLTVPQVEAILLHELSHIRRSDFLINLAVNILHTLFYYNPFIKLFVSAIDAEREKCCDETVLQYGYDKVSYAAALLTLEKNAAAAQVLAIGAAGQQHLLKRIEKIVGMEKKATFSFTQFAGIMTTVLLVILVNSLMFVSKPAEKNRQMSLIAFENPFYTLDKGDRILTPPAPPAAAQPQSQKGLLAKITVTGITTEKIINQQLTEKEKAETELYVMDDGATVNSPYINVAYNVTAQNTTAEEKIQVEKAVQTTKKLVTSAQWQEVEKEIADAMTAQEKALARQEYLKELQKVDWNGLEEKLKAHYKEMDWNKINMNLNNALAAMQLDSLQTAYSSVLNELEKAEASICSAGSVDALPVPDASKAEINAIKTQLRNRIDSIKAILNKEVISL